jgi:hypothetical protein
MVVNDRTRRVLAARLEQVLGYEEADVLIESLPPSGWADVATKPDLDAFEERTDLRFQLVESRLDALERRVDRVEGSLKDLQREVNDRFAVLVEQMGNVHEQIGRLAVEVSRHTRFTVFTVLGTGGAVLGLDRLLS